MPSALEEYRRGVKLSLPIAVAIVPFGLIVGITAEQVGFGPVLGVGSSAIIFAGASQLAAMTLLGEGAAIGVSVATALVINVRFVMYSASLRRHFAHIARWQRLAFSYLLTDQAYAVAITDYPNDPPPAVRPHRHWFYFGVGSPLWLDWMVTTTVGYLVGAAVPESWSLEFAVVLVFVALIFPAVTDRATGIAAVVGGVAALLANPLPLELGLPVGAVAGITAGVITEWVGS